MRAIVILCVVILVAGIAWFALSLRTPSHYGGTFTGAPKVELEALINRPTEFIGKQFTIEGKVEDQCPITGCFFYFRVGTQQLKVELKDIAQSLPRKAGASATVEGQLVRFGDSYQFLGSAVEFH